MKRLSVMVLVMVLGLVFTQDLHPKSFGIKSGANFANVYNVEDSFDYKTKTDLIVGGFFRFDLNTHLAIQPEAYFSMKGTKGSSGGTYSDAETTTTKTLEYDVKLNYLEIPVLLKYKIPTRGKLKPSLFLGPCVAFKLGAKLNGAYKFEMTHESPGTYIHINLEGGINEELDAVKKTDFGLVIGAGLDIEMGSGSLVIEARYTLGLNSLSNLGLTGLSNLGLFGQAIFADQTDPGAKNASFTLMLGIALK